MGGLGVKGGNVTGAAPSPKSTSLGTHVKAAQPGPNGRYLDSEFETFLFRCIICA